ncbi:MAG TPA: MMPL family transporter, partial [Gemmatimonadales bacterium]|nr:MMPL family transporter [Gemmatimonadales bacterium]
MLQSIGTRAAGTPRRVAPVVADPYHCAVFSSLGETLIRWRWPVISVWAAVAVIAALNAGKTVERLEVAGSATEPTEARHADSLIRTRFDRPLSEYFAVTVQGPASVIEGEGGMLLDRLLQAAASQPATRGTVSWRSTGDSAFLARDGRTTFFLVALEPEDLRPAEEVQPLRQSLDSVLRRFPDRDAYTIRVTGRAALDLDIRNVSADDATRNEQRLVPLTLGILILAFGALVAAVLPIIVGVMAILIALTVVGVIATITPMSVFVLNMITMIGLGVGIDYSLL